MAATKETASHPLSHTAQTDEPDSHEASAKMSQQSYVQGRKRAPVEVNELQNLRYSLMR